MLPNKTGETSAEKQKEILFNMDQSAFHPPISLSSLVHHLLWSVLRQQAGRQMGSWPDREDTAGLVYAGPGLDHVAGLLRHGAAG